jgi:hypothetical protein
LTPGAPFEGFTVRLEDGTGTLIRTYTNNNSGGGSITGGAWVGTPSAAGATWRASNSDFDIQHDYSLPAGQKYIDITTGITANIAVGKLWFGRFIDPDAMPMPGDTSATDNVLGYGALSRANVAFSEATVSRYALGLYTAASTGKAGVSGTWSTNGTGSFGNASALSTIYTPSAGELTNGSVVIYLTTNDPAGNCPPAIDSLVANFSTQATLSVQLQNSICAGSNVSLTAVAAGSINSYQWTSNGSGTFTIRISKIW